jgi:hypothetical protein
MNNNYKIIEPVAFAVIIRQEMKTFLNHLAPSVMLLAFCGTCIAGPTVVVHPKSASVTIRDSDSGVVQELKDPKQIKLVQDAFIRAMHVGDTATKLTRATHKFDFSDRWLVDINSGEIGVLTKVVTHVYQIDTKDLAAIKSLLDPKAEQVAP